jgi:serine/threonine-protein kinase HipA
MNLIRLERRDLAMVCGDQGRRARAENIRSQAVRFLLDPAEAEQIVKDMAGTVAASWYEIARGEGVSETDCEQIKGAFAYPGFWPARGDASSG